jgi:hypothetical protein
VNGTNLDPSAQNKRLSHPTAELMLWRILVLEIIADPAIVVGDVAPDNFN